MVSDRIHLDDGSLFTGTGGRTQFFTPSYRTFGTRSDCDGHHHRIIPLQSHKPKIVVLERSPDIDIVTHIA
jgi:hypothetical protein